MEIDKALRENEKKYHDLVNQNPDGIFMLDKSGRIMTINGAICQKLGFTEEELFSKNIWDLINEQDLKQYKQRLTMILKGELIEGAAE